VVQNITQFCWKYSSSSAAKEIFSKSATILESYCQKFGGFLFWGHGVFTINPLQFKLGHFATNWVF